jgi:hypothetical protein
VPGQPDVFDVVTEGLPSAAQVAELAGFDGGLGALPGLLGLLDGGEGAGGSLPATKVAVERDVADPAAVIGADSDRSHAVRVALPCQRNVNKTVATVNGSRDPVATQRPLILGIPGVAACLWVTTRPLRTALTR